MKCSLIAIAFFCTVPISCQKPIRSADKTNADKTNADKTFDHSAWSRILSDTVRSERVDYLAVRKKHWKALLGYLERLAVAKPDRLSRDEQLALYINLYNATMVKAVVERLRDGYSPSDKEFSVFKANIARVSGKTLSLDHLENKLIRPTFKEPRIHVALVCGARSCPPLMPRAYTGKDLDKELERNMRAFVNNPFRNRQNQATKTLSLSKLFDWYKDDFGGERGRIDYVRKYANNDVRGFKVEFIEYSWKLNILAPKAGRWVKITRDTVGLEDAEGASKKRARRSEIYEVLGEKGGRLRIELPFGGGTAWIPARSAAPYRPERG